MSAAPAGYEAARTGAALSPLPRAVVAVTGPLRQKFLHGILSNDVLSRTAGQGCLAALMDARGHLLQLLRVLVGADTVWLEAPAERLDALERDLQHYRVAAPVRFARPALEVLGLLGPGAAALLSGAGLGFDEGALPAEGHAAGTIAGAAVRAARASDLPAGGFSLHVPSESTAAVRAALEAAGAATIDAATLDVLRVEDGRPWYGPDVTEANLLHETGLVRVYHSGTKGCYVGQEVIARLEARGGNVSRALRGLRLGAPARAGDAVRFEGAEVGRVTTAGVSPRLGPIAMGYVHRSRFEPGTSVEVAGAPATVALLPLDAA